MFQVKWWSTVNEPYTHAFGFEGTMFAPGLNSNGVGVYLAAHNMIKAHARAYHLYDKYYRSKQKGEPYFHKLSRQKLISLKNLSLPQLSCDNKFKY
jgi:beta-glucosidase/6-phospho-beta-glucosidase/beta-galactosidase